MYSGCCKVWASSLPYGNGLDTGQVCVPHLNTLLNEITGVCKSQTDHRHQRQGQGPTLKGYCKRQGEFTKALLQERQDGLRKWMSPRPKHNSKEMECQGEAGTVSCTYSH